jgi:hypothetical protein
MSLTSFLKNSADVRERFKAEFVMPPLDTIKELAAPPLTKNYSLVGTAFDYLLRFQIQRLNPKSIVREWTTESVKEFPHIVDKAKQAHQQYLLKGKINDELLSAILCLAQLEPLSRRLVDESYLKTIGKIDREDIRDLQKLASLVESKIFSARKVCVLNQTFGQASELVGGADCDLVIDDALIEIKTTKDFVVRREYFDQLIGYYILFRIGGIEGLSKNHSIKRLGIYFSRHGHLWLFNVNDVIKEKQLSEFINWFKKRAKQEFQNN